MLFVVTIFGQPTVGDLAFKLSLPQRNLPPFSLHHGIAYFLGADSLGRSLLARIIIGAQNTLGIAATTVGASLLLGGFLGLLAGYFRGWFDQAIMRVTDIVMSFPGLLFALVILYVLGSSVINVILVLTFARFPIYLRTIRAVVLEVRERVFVRASQLMGAQSGHVLRRHILPVVASTLITIAAVEFATVILTESALSFLGFGIQPPAFTWGAMVASGRGYLATAWWIASWPGLMIVLTTLSLNLLASWARIATDPQQRWRLDPSRGKSNG
jgi:peptide/nickel transport system permease protein